MMNPESCDTFVVLPSVTASQQMIFGKNSDRPNGEVQEIVFVAAQNFQPNSLQKCTYISVDSIRKTYATILSKPAWMWGAEMGSNEHSVCIGNEAIWNKLITAEDSKPKLLGMDLVRLGLERSKTAREAVDVITGLLEKYGQGGICSDTHKDLVYHNGFLIVDPNEAWVLETAGSEWAAEKVESEFRNISNCLSIGSKIDRMSLGLKQTALDKGFWDGVEPFDFAKVFQDPEHNDRDRLEAGKRLLAEHSKDSKFTIKSMIGVLRDKPSRICRGCSDSFPTASSQVSTLGQSNRPSCHWFTGTPDTQYSYFKPFIFHPNVTIASSKTLSTGTDHKHFLFKQHQLFYEKLQNDPELQQTLKQIETVCIDELEQLLDGYDENEASQNEIDSLFQDSVESELRFYR